MSMGEKDFKNLIDKETEELQIPESLQPEAVEKRLLEHKHKKRIKLYRGILTAAACCAVVAGVGIVGTKMSGDSSETLTAETTEEKEIQSAEEINGIAVADNYDQIYEMIESQIEESKSQQARWYGAETTAVKEAATADTSGAASSEAGYSDTNVREEGVGEADIIKTDGKHMFILNNDKIRIVGIESDELEDLGTIQLESESYFAELYVKDDRVAVFYTQDSYEEPANASKSLTGGIYRQFAVAEVFDISDPENPERIGKISQSGNYDTMRAVGDHIYLFSNFYTDISYGKGATYSYIPEVQGESIASNDILLPSIANGTSYTVISSFSLQNPEEKIDKKAVFGNDDFGYISSESIFLCETLGNPEGSDVTQTCIRKLSYGDGKIKAVGQTKVDGTLNNSFSIDEYEGNVRLVTTVTPVYGDVMPLAEAAVESPASDSEDSSTEIYNTLYILGEELEELSKIENLAPDEDVYSARFMGDIGYFVTYKQIDPLFSVDLSDPKNPKVLGELKIPGFSEYLHPYGEGQLLGIGMDVDETGTVTNGVKLSMFDVSDPTDVQEVEKYVIEDAYATEVGYNYKAALVDAEENLIGFLAYCDSGANYYVFSYGEDGFTCEFEKDMLGYNNNIRGIYVDDKFYIVTASTVESFMLDSFDKVDDIVL